MAVQIKDDAPDLMAFVEDPNDRNVVQDSFKLLDLRNCELVSGGIKEAIEVLSQRKSPKYLIIDVSKSDLPISELNRLMEVAEPGVGIIVLGKKNDVGIYRDLIKMGVSDYLVAPLLPEILWRALKTLTVGEDKSKSTHSKVGKVIAISGSRGGVGTTILATNIGAVLSEEKSRRTVLVDLDLHYGTVSLYCDVKVNEGFMDAIQNPDRMDKIIIERMLVPVNDRFSIVSSLEALTVDLKYNIKGIQTLFSYLTKIFHYVLVDIPHHSDQATNAVISNADMLVLITDPSLPGLRDTKRITELFGHEATGRRVIVVINKAEAYTKNEVTQTFFEEALNRKVGHVIKYDSVTPMECINNGKLLYKEEGPLSTGIREIVDDLLGVRSTEIQKKGGIGTFFKSFKLS